MLVKNIRSKVRYWHPFLKRYFSALIAILVDLDGNIVAIHVIYLNPKTGLQIKSDESKLTFGYMKGSAIHLGDVKDKLVICEGLEDGLSLFQEYKTPVWVGCGGNTASIKVPKTVKKVIIAADNDKSGAGIRMARTLSTRLKNEGFEVITIIPPKPSKDFNQHFSKQRNEEK